ncbi:hypothetical protein M3J09_011194 [Ascochyta lentis]
MWYSTTILTCIRSLLVSRRENKSMLIPSILFVAECHSYLYVYSQVTSLRFA